LEQGKLAIIEEDH
jgi:hypothetical protein